jgi:hypothetical protein
MAIDATTPRSRRALLGAALGGAAVAATHTLTRPLPAAAATGDSVLLGKGSVAGENEADAVTTVTNTTDGQASLAGVHAAAGTGVAGSSASGVGVSGTVGDTTGAMLPGETGVFGFSDVSIDSTGVFGQSDSGLGVLALGDIGAVAMGITGPGAIAFGEWGVYGTGNVGVMGDVAATGTGVYGFAGDTAAPLPSAGVGVYARAGTTSQVALHVVGKAKFTRSGRVTFNASAKTVTLSGVVPTSFVLANLQTHVSGLYIRAVVPTTGSFRIYLSKSPGRNVTVGWLVLERP